MFFTQIRKSEHYRRFHENEVPWSEVVTIILGASKQMRRKGRNIEIETDRYYVLCELNENILWVLNAKRKGD